QTADGYSVTLTHLGSITVRRGDTVREGAAVGTIGPSGELEHDVPHVHLGIRRSEDQNGYVDPLLFLPAQPALPPAPTAAPPATPPPSAPAAPAPAAPATTAPSEVAPAPAASAAPVATIAVGPPRTAQKGQPSGRAASQLGVHGADAVRPVQLAVSPTVTVSRTRRRIEARDRLAPKAGAGAATKTAKRPRPANEREQRPTPGSEPAFASPGEGKASGNGNNPSAATARVDKRGSRAVWLWLAALLPVGGVLALAGRRRRASGSPEPAPIIASNVALLPDNADLLRELDPAHRARVHDDRRRHPRAASAPARRRNLLLDGNGRERLEERACGRGGRGRPEDVRRR